MGRASFWCLLLLLAFGAAFMPASVQAEEAKSDFGLTINLFLDSYRGGSSVDQTMPEGWQNNFLPASYNMTLDSSKATIGETSLGIGLEPTWTKKNLTLGLPVFYSLSEDSRDLLLGSTTLNWWDPVTALEARMERSPDVGLSVSNGQWKGQLTFHRYDIDLVDFVGIDHPGAQNESRPAGRRTVENGTGVRLGVFRTLEYPDEGDEYWSIGGFYERNGGEVWLIGLTLNYGYRLN